MQKSADDMIKLTSIIEDADDMNISYDYIFVDMQVNNNGGPSIVRELKRSEKVIDSTIVLLIDREADSFQAKRVGADEYLLKPIEKTKLKKLFT
jgi:DNA-binding response OmpR family regulator